ncbi:MAG TPA: IPT/TIG domain-containing protein, partial [Terracidiphilus sp.]|nr:IPT/TIG domain-containing protein [Terracidiphilus sp.]
QSTNPTISTNGGGLIIMGAPDADPTCAAVADTDCLVAPSAVTPSDGTGPSLTINANLIMGNSADSGSGGGIALQNVNGSDVVTFPGVPQLWNSVNITNNIIANNLAGWDGAGISLLDALNTNIINNTIMSNDTTASAGPLFNTLGAPLASTQGPTCTSNCGTTSAPQTAGLVSIQNSAILQANLPASITCPPGHGTGTACRNYSVPVLYNDVFWQNRSFYIGVGPLGAGTLNQQNVVALYNAFTTSQVTTEPTANATTPNGGGVIISGGTGACVPGTRYWDIGVRGDTGPSNHASGLTLTPTYSVLTDAADYPGNNNQGSNPTVVSQYCNGSRTPPEYKSLGYQVPPGISDATVPNPIFNLTPAATVDEGNNWINLSWGPLAVNGPVTGTVLGNYSLAAGSPAINYIPPLAILAENAALLLDLAPSVPNTDFFGNPRPASPLTNTDVGAVEFRGGGGATPTLTSISPATGFRSTSFTVTLTGTNLTGATAVNVSGLLNGITVSNVVVVNATTVTATFTIGALAPLNTARNVTVVTPNGTTNAMTFTVVTPPVPALTSISPNAHTRGGAGFTVTLTGANLTGTTAVTVSGTGVTRTNITVVNDTTVTATFTITGTALQTTRTVTVTTPNGTSNSVNFTVQ